MTRRGPPPGARHQCVRVGISLRGGSARALHSSTMARLGAVATSANRRLGASRQVSPLGEDFTPSPPSPGARSQGGEVGVLREWTRVSHVPGAHRVSGNCNHVDETLEMRYTSLRTAYPFPPRELPHTLGVRVQRGHSEPLLPSHHSPACLFGPWLSSLSQRPAHRFQTRQWAVAPRATICLRTEPTYKGLGCDVAWLEWWAYPGSIEVGEGSEVIADSAAQRCPVSVLEMRPDAC